MKGRHFSSSPQRERKNASSSSSSSNAPSTNQKGFSFVSSPTFQGDNKLGYSSAVRSILIGIPPSNQEIEDFIFSTEEYIERERHTKTMSPEALIVMEDAKRLLKDIRLFIDSKNQNEEFQHLLIKCQQITERLKERLDKERHNLNLGFSDSLKTLEGISSDVSHLGKNLIISGEFRKLLFEGFKTLQLLINLLTDRWIEKHKEPLQQSSSTSFDYYDLNKNDNDINDNNNNNNNNNDDDDFDHDKNKIKERKDRRKQRKIQRQKQNFIKGNPTFDHQLDELTEKSIALLTMMKENPEYHRAIRGIFHLMKNFRAQRQLVQNDFIKSIHDELEDVRNLAISILNHFVKKPHFVDHLVEEINDWFKFISEDPEISHFIENTESLIHFLLERPETIDHRIVREHIRTAKNLFIKKEQREFHHLSSIIIRDLLRLFEMIRTDEDVIRIAMGIERLIDDFLVKNIINSNQRKFKFDWALLGEIKSLLIPMILENLKEIYIPRMEFSSGNYDFIAEDIHISALSLLPENIHIEWYNGIDLGFRRRNNWGGSKTSSSINQHYSDPFFHYSSTNPHPIYQNLHQVPIPSRSKQPSSSSSQNRNYYYQDVDRPEYDHSHNLSFFDQHRPHHQQQQQHLHQQSHPHQSYQQQQHPQQHLFHHSNEPSRWSYDDPRTRSIKENCPPIHPDTANSLLRIRIFHLTTKIENVHFWFRHRTTPVWEDYGIMDLILGGEGLFISIVLQGYGDNKDYTDGPYLPNHRMGEKRSFLGVRNVFVDIDDLVIRFRDTKHDLLYSLITSVLKPMIISRLETIISQKVTELLSGSYNNISNFWHRLKDELSQWIASNFLPFDKKSSSTFDPFNKNQFSFSSTSVTSFTNASSKKKNLKQKKQSGKSKKITSKDKYHESDEEEEDHEEDHESDRESYSSINDNDSSDTESEYSSENTTESSSESEDDENDDGFPQSYNVTPQDTPTMTSKMTPKMTPKNHHDNINENENENENENDQQRKEREKSYLKRNRYPKTWEAQNLHSQSPVSVIVTDTSTPLSPKISLKKSNDHIIDNTNNNNNNNNISSFNQETLSSFSSTTSTATSTILSSSSKNIEKEREKEERRKKKQQQQQQQQSKENESNKIQNKDEEFETIKLNETSSMNPESSTSSSSSSSSSAFSSQNEKKDNHENFDFDHHHLETKSFEGSSKDVLSPTTTLLPSMIRSRQRNLKIPRGIDQINQKERSTQRINTPQVQKQKQKPQEERHDDNDDDDEEELEAGGSMDEEERIMTRQKMKRPIVPSTHKTNQRFVNSPILSRKSPTTMQRISPLIRNPVLGNSPSLARSPSPSPSPSPNSSSNSNSNSSSSSMRKGIVLGNFYPSTPPPSPLNFSQEVRAKNFQGSVSPDPFTSFVSE